MPVYKVKAIRHTTETRLVVSQAEFTLEADDEADAKQSAAALAANQGVSFHALEEADLCWEEVSTDDEHSEEQEATYEIDGDPVKIDLGPEEETDFFKPDPAIKPRETVERPLDPVVATRLEEIKAKFAEALKGYIGDPVTPEAYEQYKAETLEVIRSLSPDTSDVEIVDTPDGGCVIRFSILAAWATPCPMRSIDRLREGLALLQPFETDGKVHQLRYPGLGVETRVVPLDVETRVQELGWSWSTDTEGDAGQLWLFSF